MIKIYIFIGEEGRLKWRFGKKVLIFKANLQKERRGGEKPDMTQSKTKPEKA